MDDLITVVSTKHNLSLDTAGREAHPDISPFDSLVISVIRDQEKHDDAAQIKKAKSQKDSDVKEVSKLFCFDNNIAFHLLFSPFFSTAF